MSYKSLRDFCMRADLVESGWVIAELDKLKEKVDGLKDALEFYADPNMWGNQVLTGNPEEPDVEYIHEVIEDHGEIARKALGK